jgi:hypothetical protein
MRLLAAFPHLGEVSLRGTSITDAGLKHLAQFKTLKGVVLEGTKTTREGVAEFQRALPECRVKWDGGVNKAAANLDRRAAEWVIQLGGSLAVQLPDGRELECSEDVPLPAEDFHVLSIDLDETTITDRGIETLVTIPTLQRLFLRKTKITDAGVQKLSALTGLELLGLDGTRISDRGLESLEKLSRLETLEIKGVPKSVTAKGVERLKAALPKCNISYEVDPQLTEPAPAPTPPKSRESSDKKTSQLGPVLEIREATKLDPKKTKQTDLALRFCLPRRNSERQARALHSPALGGCRAPTEWFAGDFVAGTHADVQQQADADGGHQQA